MAAHGNRRRSLGGIMGIYFGGLPGSRILFGQEFCLGRRNPCKAICRVLSGGVCQA
jgi:hypothetical protein